MQLADCVGSLVQFAARVLSKLRESCNFLREFSRVLSCSFLRMFSHAARSDACVLVNLVAHIALVLFALRVPSCFGSARSRMLLALHVLSCALLCVRSCSSCSDVPLCFLLCKCSLATYSLHVLFAISVRQFAVRYGCGLTEEPFAMLLGKHTSIAHTHTSQKSRVQIPGKKKKNV